MGGKNLIWISDTINLKKITFVLSHFGESHLCDDEGILLPCGTFKKSVHFTFTHTIEGRIQQIKRKM